MTAWPAALPLAVAGGVLGAVIGSFIATVALRWPEGRTLAGRSTCDGCGRQLTAAELVPLLSAMATRWRCRSCGAAINPLHAIGEALGAGVGVAAALAATAPLPALILALFGWQLLTLALIDARALWLPDRWTLPLALIGLALAPLALPVRVEDQVIGGIAGFASLWAIGALYRAFRGRDGLGGGDPKLLGALGCWLGWQPLAPTLLIAALLGLAAALWLHIRGHPLRADTALPLGSCMAPAGFAIALALAHGGGAAMALPGI